MHPFEYLINAFICILLNEHFAIVIWIFITYLKVNCSQVELCFKLGWIYDDTLLLLYFNIMWHRQKNNVIKCFNDLICSLFQDIKLLFVFHCNTLFCRENLFYLTLTNNLFINRGRHFVESSHRTTIMPPTCCKQTLRIWNSRSFPREDFSRWCACAWALGGVRQSPRSPPRGPTPRSTRPAVSPTHPHHRMSPKP